MKRLSLLCAAALTAGFVAAPASAQVIKYGDVSPTGNYAAFLAALSTLSTSPTTITFNDQVAGLLNPAFYPGVTFASVRSFNEVVDNAGPGQGNDTSPPLSTGEGPHTSSPYVLGASAPSSLTISFTRGPVSGAGLFLVDFFHPDGSTNVVSLEAFSGLNGTGTSLGSFTGVEYNFQNNNSYFMGFTSGGADIGSLVLTRESDFTGDAFGVDDVTFAVPTATGVTATPEPASLTLIATGLVGVAGVVRRKRKAATAA